MLVDAVTLQWTIRLLRSVLAGYGGEHRRFDALRVVIVELHDCYIAAVGEEP